MILPTKTQCLMIMLIIGGFIASSPVNAQDDLRSDDIFATVDGEPLSIADLQLVLQQRFGNDLSASSLVKNVAPNQLRRAAALMVVRQQLAMRALQNLAGGSLEKVFEVAEADLEMQMQQRGVSIDSQAELTGLSADAMRRSSRWRAAWGQYLKRHLNEANLRRFHDQNRQRYGDVDYEDVVDPLGLRRDATAAIFNNLVDQSSDADVVWHIETLRPPVDRTPPNNDAKADKILGQTSR